MGLAAEEEKFRKIQFSQIGFRRRRRKRGGGRDSTRRRCFLAAKEDTTGEKRISLKHPLHLFSLDRGCYTRAAFYI